MIRKTEVRNAMNPGSPIPRKETLGLFFEDSSSHLPMVSLETSGAYRLSPTKRLVRIPVSSPRTRYREDLEKLHNSSPTRRRNQLNPDVEFSQNPTFLSDGQKERFQSPESVRKKLRFEDASESLEESKYSESINSHIAEAKEVLESLKNRKKSELNAKKDADSDKIKGCLKELKTATAALNQIGVVLGEAAEVLSTSAQYLDDTVIRISTPNYYRRHEYPNSHRLIRSPF